jgi:hypothetical protein
VVVTIQRDDSVDTSGKPQVDIVQSMVDFVLSQLAGGASNPWSKILPNADPACTRVGLKINCLNSIVPTSPAMVRAIIHNLINNGGFCAGNIVVWERYLQDATDAKYSEPDLLGARLAGTCDLPGVNGGPPINGKGPGYGDTWAGIVGSDPSLSPRLSRILTEQTDVTINCPVLKAHPESGFTAGLKNCYGMFDSPGNYHSPYLTQALPTLYATPQIRNSIKLTIVDALQASVTRDNISAIDRTPGRIFASLDPLVSDYYALDLTNQLRALRRPVATQPVPTGSLGWMDYAYQIGLGAKTYNLVSLLANGDVAVDGGAADAASEAI